MPGMRSLTGAHGGQRSDISPLGRELTRRTLFTSPKGARDRRIGTLRDLRSQRANGTDGLLEVRIEVVPELLTSKALLFRRLLQRIDTPKIRYRLIHHTSGAGSAPTLTSQDAHAALARLKSGQYTA